MQCFFAGTFFIELSQRFPSPVHAGSAASSGFCGLIAIFASRMLVREPIHGMQGVLIRLLGLGKLYFMTFPHAKI